MGISFSIISGEVDEISSLEKSKSSGKGFPLGSFVFGYLSSSKNGCRRISRGLSLLSGLYTRILEIMSIASGGVLALKTLFQGCAFICGNLNSE